MGATSDGVVSSVDNPMVGIIGSSYILSHSF